MPDRSFSTSGRRLRGRRDGRPTARRLRMESLESRRLLDAAGLAWSDAPDLSISFVPDGTQVGPYSSELYSAMESVAAPNVWQDKMLQAFRLWAEHANAGAQVVGDSGVALGTIGPKQGDPRFGDVRIAAVPLPEDIIALSVPNDTVTSGTWSGDVLFNSNVDFASLDELFAVTVHEAGHVFGLGHSAEPLSPMSTHGIPESVTPTALDILDLQSLYGAPLADRTDGGSDGDDHVHEDEQEEHANDLLINAAAVTLTPYFAGAVRYDGAGRIADPSDVDFFHLSPTSEQFEPFDILTVTVRSVGADRLAPLAEIFDHEGEVIDSEVLVNGDGEFTIQIAGKDPDHDYFLRIEPDPLEPDFAIGDYQFTASFGKQATEIVELKDGHFDHEINAITDTLHVPRSSLVHFVLEAKALEQPSDVVIWAAIYDAQGDPVFQVAAQPGQARSGVTTLLATGTYHIELRAASPTEADLPEIEFEFQGTATSIPIGPGISDPTGTPILPCGEIGADANQCLPSNLVIGDPAVIPTPLPEPPAPTVVVDPPWLVLGNWYWSGQDAAAPSANSTNAWHNASRPTDVNSDGLVTPLDALLIINHLSRSSTSVLPAHSTNAPLVDVTNDSLVTPLDALRVINQLNLQSSAGEGEAAPPLTVDASWLAALDQALDPIDLSDLLDQPTKSNAGSDSAASQADEVLGTWMLLGGTDYWPWFSWSGSL